MPYIKTTIGEHDYHRPACSAFCKIGGEYCPFVKAQRTSVSDIVRWTDIADARNNGAIGGTEVVGGTQKGYTASFDKETARELPKQNEELTPVEKSLVTERRLCKPTCWGDGSGFEFDQMSNNLMGPGCSVEHVYDITSYGIEHNVLQFSRWNAWIDKFQYDYRFGRVSDTNAECILFPNVDNPWMFTEYVFKGIGDDAKKCAVSIPKEYVVEPQLYDPLTLKIVNGDLTLDGYDAFDGKYVRYCDDGTIQSSEEESSSSPEDATYLVKRRRKIIDWSELTTWTMDDVYGDAATYARMNKDNRYVGVPDSGLSLYRARIPVQCIKWGEHGNIPPHTLDMTAPKSWFDPANMVTKMKAVYDAVVGTTIDSPYDGKIEWGNVVDENGNDMIGQQGRQAYVYVDMELSEDVDSKGAKICKYSGGTKTAVEVPQVEEKGVMKALKPFRKIMPSSDYGEYCHMGCKNLIGINGSLQCKLMMGSNGNLSYNEYFGRDKCLHAGGYGGENACPQYVATTKRPQIASYQDKRIAVDQMSSNLGSAAAGGMLIGIAGGVMGAETAAAYTVSTMGMEMDKIAQYYSNLGKRGDIDITYLVRYEPVMGTNAQAQLNKRKYNEYGKGVQIVPGTGRYAIDSEANANPFSGGDTNVYNDINTISFHRFFASVMHCANHKYCNMISGKAHEQGFSFSKRAGGDDDCRYHREELNGVEGCPYNCAPKRAIEFAHCATAISTRVLSLMNAYNELAAYFMWDFDPGEYSPDTLDMYKKEVVGNYTWCVVGTFAVCQKTDEIAVVAVKLEDEGNSGEGNIDYSVEWFGAALLRSIPGDTIAPPEHFMIIGEFRTKMTETWVLVLKGVESQYESDDSYEGEEDESSGYHHVKARVYSSSDAFYWFQPLDNNGSKLSDNADSLPSLRQHVDENGYWFCKAELVGIPSSNCVMLDNDEKFIGGWHPEYKDYGKIGEEFMQDVAVEEEREGMGKGDYVLNGDYTPIPYTVNKQGYWIDQSGEYIVDESPIGADLPIAYDHEREGNVSANSICISFKKSNTTVDGETGKRIEPKTTNGALFANDPYALVVTAFREAKKKDEITGEFKGRPMFKDPDTGEEYLAPLLMNESMLPTLRHALHCPKCDYYIVYKYSAGKLEMPSSSSEESSSEEEEETGSGEKDIMTCPWCGEHYEVITGDVGEGLQEGKTWSKDASIMRKFPKIYSIGMADVWAPPGTAVKTDAYFWRHQAQITNATKRQIIHRLGDSNKNAKPIDMQNGRETGGCYKFNKMTPQSEMTLGYPEGLGKFIKIPKGAESDDQTTLRYGKKYIKWKPEQDACVEGMWNPVVPRHMIPEWYGKSDEGDEDEGVIAPYTDSSNDALKMVSYDQMKIFRNGIEPIYAYVVGENATSGDYPTMRASYDQRESVTQPIIWHGRRSTISPQVLAATDDGRDSYQTYFSGDYVYGNVREYFPSGYTWWMLKNILGGRYTDNKGGGYHMDDGGTQLGGRMVGGSGGEYTCGTRTVAKCAMSIYGVLPLDKEIVKAYLIIRPSGVDPSKNPIGRSWTGGPVMYCHYHALPKEHYDDGHYKHLHGTAGYPPGQYFDDDGNFVNEHPGTIYYSADDIAYQDDSAYRLWGRESHLVEDDRGLYYETNVKDTMTSIPCLYDTTFHRRVGTPKKSVMKYNNDSELLGIGYDHESFGSVAGFLMYNLSNTEWKRKQKYQYLVVDSDGMLVMKYPESTMWKTDTGEQIEKTISNHMATVELKVSDGSVERTKTYRFRQADSDLYADQMPRQSQAITGYFDMSWANTKGYVYDEYAVEKSRGGSGWNAPVVFQGDEPASSNASSVTGSFSYEGGGVGFQVGEVARCLDITENIQYLYNNRIDRTFVVEAGATLEEVMKWKYYETLKGEKLSEIDDDVKLQNSQVDRLDDGSCLLTDGYAYPELEGDVTDVPSIDPDGEKYVLAKKEARVVIQMAFPLVIGENNSVYKLTVNGSVVSGNIPSGRYEDMDSIIGHVESMFNGATVERASAFRLIVKSDKEIVISKCDKDCYESFGLSAPTTVSPLQNRTYDVTNSVAGFEPVNLMGAEDGGTWTYDTYNESPQSFSVDLLRAPLCMLQRNWRYEEGDNENPGDGIMTYFYDAPFSPDPYITKVFISPQENLPTSYRVFVKPSVFSSWRCIVNVEYRSNINQDGGKYSVVFPGKSSSIEASVDETTGSATVTIEDHSVRARLVKVECDSEMKDFLHEYELKHSFDNNGYQVIANGEFAGMGMISFEGLQAVILPHPVSEGADPFDFATEENTFEIVAAQLIGDGNSTMRIALNKMAYGDGGTYETIDGTYIYFHALRQTGGLSKFKVYGCHYKTEEHDSAENDPESGKKYLTVTGMEDEYRWKLNVQTTKYSMPEPPTQILDVSVGTAGSGGVVLTEAENENTPLVWLTKTESVTINVQDENGKLVPKTYSYQRITGGNYFYDIYKGKIYLPKNNADDIPWNDFEKEVKDINSFRSYLPNTLVMRCWSGNGKSITFTAKADGNGPSYMLEKNAIQEVAEGTTLPDNGTSCKMLDMYGNIVNGKKIPWICYNNKPCTLPVDYQSGSMQAVAQHSRTAGEFRKPFFTGKEIGDKIDDDDAFVSLFGEHCESCYGRCETEITLTGAPNQILSGRLEFVAKAVTKRSVDVGGKTLYYKERTGGLDKGIIIVSCAPVSSGGGRMTLCYSLPEIVIYAKEAEILTESEQDE